MTTTSLDYYWIDEDTDVSTTSVIVVVEVGEDVTYDVAEGLCNEYVRAKSEDEDWSWGYAPLVRCIYAKRHRDRPRQKASTYG